MKTTKTVTKATKPKQDKIYLLQRVDTKQFYCRDNGMRTYWNAEKAAGFPFESRNKAMTKRGEIDEICNIVELVKSKK